MLPNRDQRISEFHLNKDAIIYVRQSTQNQVKTHKESLKLQIAIKERAVNLGWPNPILIDDDLGISAAGFMEREGFQRMLTKVTMKQVGIIFCLEASRLSRNNKDWANLFELCGFFNTLIADIEQIYDLNFPNDRLLLGIKGSISELELSILNNRLQKGLIQKAERGELKFFLPPGYQFDEDNNIVKDADQRITYAIETMFNEFKKHTSIRQLVQWYGDNKILFPVRKLKKNAPICWKIPKYENLVKLLQHPIYAGVYTYGRRQTLHDYKNGTLVKRKSDFLPPEQWKVLIKDHHESYITWKEYIATQDKIAQNRPRWIMDENLCAIREGTALLVGLLRCGHCGNKLFVKYKTKDNQSAMYFCRGFEREKIRKCISFGSQVIDKSISKEVIKAIKPASIQAGLDALQIAESEKDKKIKLIQLEVQNAEYQADRAFDQYNLVDPKNRLVAATLENRFNEKLIELSHAKEKLSQCENNTRTLTVEDKKQIFELSHCFEKVWNHKEVDPKLKKQILRLMIREIIVTHHEKDSSLNLVVHWNGGCHTKIYIKKRVTPQGNKTDLSLVNKVEKLSCCIADAEIARVLNMSGEKTPTGLLWNKDRVTNFRNKHHIKIQIKNKTNLFSAKAAADYLGISRRTLHKMVNRKLIDTNQIMSFAPWQIRKEQLDSEKVQKFVKAFKEGNVRSIHQLELFE